MFSLSPTATGNNQPSMMTFHRNTRIHRTSPKLRVHDKTYTRPCPQPIFEPRECWRGSHFRQLNRRIAFGIFIPLQATGGFGPAIPPASLVAPESDPERTWVV